MTNWRTLLDQLGDDRSIQIRRRGAKALELRVVDDDPDGRGAWCEVTLQAIERIEVIDVVECSVTHLIQQLDTP